MSILSGYGKFKRYVLTDSGYKLCSQWTSSNTVHFDDDKTAQTKLGAIDGITDSLTATSSNVALSSKAGNNLQSQINKLNTGIMHRWDILYNSTISEEIAIQFMNYRLLKICIIDAVNNVVIASDMINPPLLLALSSSNIRDYISYRESASVWVTLIVEAKSETLLKCTLGFGDFYSAGRLFYYIYGID